LKSAPVGPGNPAIDRSSSCPFARPKRNFDLPANANHRLVRPDAMESEFRFWIILTVEAAACIGFLRVGLRTMCLRLLAVAGVFLVATVLTVWSALQSSAALAGAGLALGFVGSVVGCAMLAELHERAREF
jgi:hypothetical protein